jgi:hypothetical protein
LDNQPAVSPPGFPFVSEPSEKHECFSEGLLTKEKPGGETAGYLSTGQILAEKD